MAVYENGELVLYGFVGEDYWDEGFTAREVISALAEHGRDNDITVRVNSGGGYTHEGMSIYNALKAHAGNVRIEVDGVALSSASLLAMAGDEIVMKAGALMMIHDPSGITIGNADDHEKSREMLDKVGDSMASIYAQRSGKDAADVRAAMKDEIWLTAEEAVEQGYATEAESAKAKAVAAFDYRIYAHAPQKLKTLASKKHWSLEEAMTKAASSAQPLEPKEPLMATDTTATGLTPADIDKAKAEASANATKTTAATAADIADVCIAAGVPAMASALIREGVSLDDAKARTNSAKDIRAAVDLARKTSPSIEASFADTMIAAGLTLAQAREKLFEKMTASQSPDISASHQVDGSTSTSTRPKAKVDIVANMKQRVGAQ